MATKVSPSVTEHREATCCVPYQKVLRAKPALGHAPTHKLGPRKNTMQHRRCRAPAGRRDLITTGKGAATPTYRDGARHRNSKAYHD
ncbi:hypothetical protein Taro_030908 [Colocasia esculenta]|uniref:Uncharacterized protein n=1 Tax=Colocasia esculenta TaxID=4460 RepID=A0A843VMK5_COLES|nr:hypothetical protein [Colocasia esculenta]